ncbi:hypothetical protein EJ05DRAFT_474484 [Pseudovirgaria hyperparasitica]|uniref:Uncharacterized protein n=1 Tax=Pseudovirgaria hyperparasitica TaxID=470096 RepID=A0A6A6WEP7_9PEZI|nr:uncharacterized protein EJ05DRAFT_474484 [Pseudovirgaria hyperparasitica]KAF2760629.1 hypothetical protein EJ05DRAFT_474484 [Pseudovirgaria hyperparasitica]
MQCKVGLFYAPVLCALFAFLSSYINPHYYSGCSSLVTKEVRTLCSGGFQLDQPLALALFVRVGREWMHFHWRRLPAAHPPVCR